MLSSTENIDRQELEQINEMVLKNSDDLISTIENLVDIAHLSTNQFNVNKSDFELKELLQHILKQAQEKIIIKNKQDVDIQFNLNGEIKLYSDKAIISKIILHLIKNAILFTEKGLIQLGYKQEDNNVVVYVKDTGCGINQEKIDMIFSPFQQCNENLNIKVGGTGLGLSIVNELIKLLDGKIWVDSEENKGSTFYISLPLR